MAWFTPLTWVSQNVTAALFNQQLRDNMNETAPGKATVEGRIFVSDGANSIAERIPINSVVATSEGTTSTSFTNLATSGPAVSVSTGSRALVILSANLAGNNANQFSLMTHDVSGATTVAVADAHALIYESSVANDEAQMSWVYLRTGLTAGSNVFTCKYRTTAGTATFKNRNITVIPF